VDSIYDIVWARDPETGRATTYGDVRLADELQFSVYNFEAADIEKTWKHFELYEIECAALVEQVRASLNSLRRGRGPVSPDVRAAMREEGKAVGARALRSPILAAYDLCLKCSHLFNILDSRGAISVTERVGVVARVRALAVGIAKVWVDQQRDEPAAEEEEEPAAEKKIKKIKRNVETAPTTA
jgi:glycyl-tRNA synthetase alpha chain